MVDIKKLKILRNKTEISIALCKKALEETNNDLNKAEKVLIQWGAEKISDKHGRKTTEGGLFSYIHHNQKIAALVELLCETDFVSANADFKKLGSELAMQIASLSPKDVKTLLAQEYIRDSSKKVSDLIKEAVLKFGENIKIKKFIRWNI